LEWGCVQGHDLVRETYYDYPSVTINEDEGLGVIKKTYDDTIKEVDVEKFSNVPYKYIETGKTLGLVSYKEFNTWLKEDSMIKGETIDLHPITENDIEWLRKTRNQYSDDFFTSDYIKTRANREPGMNIIKKAQLIRCLLSD